MAVSCARAFAQNEMLAARKAEMKDREIAGRRRFVASFVSICNSAEQATVPQVRSCVKIPRIRELVLSDTIEITRIQPE